jgi:hypothetical protein
MEGAKGTSLLLLPAQTLYGGEKRVVVLTFEQFLWRRKKGKLNVKIWEIYCSSGSLSCHDAGAAYHWSLCAEREPQSGQPDGTYYRGDGYYPGELVGWRLGWSGLMGPGLGWLRRLVGWLWRLRLLRWFLVVKSDF